MKDLLAGFERHERILRAISEKSIKAYRQKIQEFLAWLEGNDNLKGIEEISRQDIEQYLEWCFYKGNKNVTRFTKLTALQNFFRYLVYQGAIEQDPAADIPRPRIWKKFVQKFTKEEVLRFFAQVDINTEKGVRDAVILILAVFCGLRMNEILTVDMNDVIDHGKDLDINVKGKMHSDRAVYLWKAPALFLKEYFSIRLSQGAKGGDPFLVSYRHRKAQGRRLTGAAIDHLLKTLAKKAEIRKPEIHMHMFRATHINDLRSVKGYDLAAIAERVGHKNISTTDRYIPRRDRIHKVCSSLHEYWIGFTQIWKGVQSDDNSHGGDSVKN